MAHSNRRLRSLLVLVLLGAGALHAICATPQHAQAQASDAQSLLDAGVAARRAGHDEEALALFTRAWDAGQLPRARAQMGLAEQALGKFVDAELHLAEALSWRDAWIDERRATLEEALTSVRARLARLEVRVEQPGAQLRVNGRAVGALPLAQALVLLPGTVAVSVSAPGFATSTRTVEVVAGQLSRESFELAPLETTTRPAAGGVARVGAASGGAASGGGDAGPIDATAPSASPLPTIGWITVGVGVVGVGLGAVFYAQRESAASDYNDDARCLVGGRSRDENCGADGSAARSAETLMTVSLVAGGVLVAGGLALLLLGGRDSRETAPQQARATCVPMLGPIVGAACEGRF